MEEKYNYDDIERFAKGKLDEEELADFKQKIQQDQELKEEADFYGEVVDVFRLKGMIKDADAELDKAGFFNTAAPSPTKSNPLKPLGRRILAYAATISILLIATAFLYSNLTYSNAALASLDAAELGLDLDDTGMRSGEAAADAFADGIASLSAADYAAASRFFETITPENEAYTQAQLYLAFAHYKQNNYADAAESAQKATPALDAATRQKAEWVLLNSLLRINRVNEFQELLAQIAANNDHRYQEAAKELEQNLNSPWRSLVF